MQRHIFDGSSRVSQKQIEQEPVRRWIPPTIGKGGNLVYAEPREESTLRQTVSQTGARSDASTVVLSSEEQLANARSYEDAREQGLLLGRQEGLLQGLEEGRNQGREEGYQKGLQQGLETGRTQGHADGLSLAQSEINQQLRTLNELMTHLTHAINEQDYQLEQALVTLVREVARHVVERELLMDSSHIVRIVRRALATLPPSRDNVRILINPADLPLVQRAAEEGGENWRVISNQHIARGGCRVETDQSAVDYTTSERFSQIVEQIVSRQFGNEDAVVTSPVAPAEEFESAPQPIIRPLKLQTPADNKPGLADEAAALVGNESGSKNSLMEPD